MSGWRKRQVIEQEPRGKNSLAQPEQEPVAWVDLLKEAQQIVESKVLWKRFIDGTPLSNDIACWMAAFAQQHATPSQRTWVGLTDEQIEQMGLSNYIKVVRETEAKLKQLNQLNHGS